MKIAILGGAFDPPHPGHIRLAKLACESVNSDKLLVIPTGNAPHKTTMTAYDKRFALARAAFRAVPKHEISDIESDSRIHYTVDTLHTLHRLYQQCEIVLIVGADSRDSLAQWKDANEIARLCTVFSGERDLFSSSMIREHFTPKRYTHSINVAIMCGELSKKHGLSPIESERAYIAGLLHDISKVKQRQLGEGWDWHAVAGADYVRDELGITDFDVLNAIRYHTTGRENMSMVEKIVYIADKISAERDYEGVEELRNVAFEDLDESVRVNIIARKKKHGA
ncbi:MAG: bis(5'-nucleosyl)-tetraphosphatase (symmetrical) YqeK [Oscillospiraceae bacterium]|nr:bis(5'-nucleosyl)-tetraphosphatase (symmetrical) YqeK [Oscillospiraceae bacterium]